MGVIIHNMDKPKKCLDCRLKHKHIDYQKVYPEEYFTCPLLYDKQVPFSTSNESFCPLDETEE